MNPEISRLIEARQKEWAEARAISDRAAEEGRDFTAEEEGAWGKANEAIDALDARMTVVIVEKLPETIGHEWTKGEGWREVARG